VKRFTLVLCTDTFSAVVVNRGLNQVFESHMEKRSDLLPVSGIIFIVFVYCRHILTHSWLKALAINLSQPSSRLWLRAGLIGSSNPCCLKADLVVCANPSSTSSWM